LKYKQCGWFSRGYREVEGVVYDEGQRVAYKLLGKWNEQLTCHQAPDAAPHGNTSGPTVLWRHTVKKSTDHRLAHYGWSEYTAQLVACNNNLSLVLPPTDSRLRPDRYIPFRQYSIL